MRYSIASLTIAGLLVAGTSLAAEGNRGGEGPESGPAGDGPGGSFGPSESEHVDADTRSRESSGAVRDKARKKWEVEGIWETHRMIRQEDLDGYGVNKTVNVGFLYFRYDLTKYDRLWARGGMYQRFIADSTETGFRADDTVAAYRRLIPLPEKFAISLSGQLSAPTSFTSQKEGLITEGRITVGLEKRLDRFTFMLRSYFAGHWMRYTSAEGGAANPKWLWLASLGAEYQIPYINVITLGTSITNQYLWLYETGYNANAPSSARFGVAEDPNYGFNQPVQQAYGWEIYARYNAPDLAGVKSDLTVSYAQGDPSLGYTSALHDGARHVYPLFWRQTSTVYAALSVSY